MGVRRSLVLIATGAAGAAGILAASPGTYEALRRRLRLDDGSEHFAEDAAELPREEEDAGAATDLRLSLRARLAQDAELDPAAGQPVAEDADPRTRLAAARSRLEAAAASASAAVGAPGDPSVLEEDTADMPLPDAAERT
jgi:hypothetical protein